MWLDMKLDSIVKNKYCTVMYNFWPTKWYEPCQENGKTCDSRKVSKIV